MDSQIAPGAPASDQGNIGDESGAHSEAASGTSLSRSLVWIGLGGLAIWILLPFLAAAAWACVLANVTWPVHLRLRRWLPSSPAWVAIASTCLVTLGISAPLFGLMFWLREDLALVSGLLNAYMDRGFADVLDGLARMPIVGQVVHDYIGHNSEGSSSLRDVVKEWAALGTGEVLSVLGDVGRNAAKLGMTIVFLFLIYLYGDLLERALRSGLRRSVGVLGSTWLQIAASANRAVVISVLLSALLQGIVAGVGYWLVGFEVSLLLGVATGAASLMPILGTSLVLGPASLAQFADGHPGKALFLIAWGAVLVHPTDNILRPLLVSAAIRLPFLLVLGGIIGGLSAFGLIGVVLGPVLLAVAWNAAREVGIAS